MIRETISDIEARLQNSSSLSPETRRELTELLARLKSEVTELARTDADQAASIAGFSKSPVTPRMRPLAVKYCR